MSWAADPEGRRWHARISAGWLAWRLAERFSGLTGVPDLPVEPDIQTLGRRLLEVLNACPGEFGVPQDIGTLDQPPVVPGLPGFLLESESGLVLGESPARSVSLVLPVSGIEAGGDGLAWTFGTRFAGAAHAGHPFDFLQIILVDTTEPVTRPFLSGLSSLRRVAGRVPGYMAHSAGHETTGRVHRDLLAAGFSQEHIAAAHLAQARARGFSGPVFVAVGIPSAFAFELVAPFVAEMKAAIAAVNAAARAGTAGVDGCDGRQCSDCDERDVCDRVRAVLRGHPGDSRDGGLA